MSAIPGQVFEELCLVLAATFQNYPWGWKNSCGWEVKGTSSVKEPSRQPTACHLVSRALELFSLSALIPGDWYQHLVVETLELTAEFQEAVCRRRSELLTIWKPPTKADVATCLFWLWNNIRGQKHIKNYPLRMKLDNSEKVVEE